MTAAEVPPSVWHAFLGYVLIPIGACLIGLFLDRVFRGGILRW